MEHIWYGARITEENGRTADAEFAKESSLGGINAVQFAARYPERVAAVIVEDVVELRSFLRSL